MIRIRDNILRNGVQYDDFTFFITCTYQYFCTIVHFEAYFFQLQRLNKKCFIFLKNCRMIKKKVSVLSKGWEQCLANAYRRGTDMQLKLTDRFDPLSIAELLVS